MTTTVSAKPSVYAPRGGIFPGELGGYGGICSINSEGDGAYYWSASKSVQHAEKLRRYVELGLQGKLYGQGGMASTSTSRALAELSTFAEGVVPDLPELLQATAEQVLNESPVSLWHVEHVHSTYQYLIGHGAERVTRRQHQEFLDVAYKALYPQWEAIDELKNPKDWYRKTKLMQSVFGQDLIITEQELAVRVPQIMKETSKQVFEKARNVGGLHPIDMDSATGIWPMQDRLLFSNHGLHSYLGDSDKQEITGDYLKLRDEMYRAAHPTLATLSDVWKMYKGDARETRDFFVKVGRKLGILPTNDAK